MKVDIKEVVSKGVELLDDAVPDWRESIDPETLNMGSQNHCILGQIYTDFFEGMGELFGTSHNAVIAMSYGFDYDLYPEEPEYREAMALLKDEWILTLG